MSCAAAPPASAGISAGCCTNGRPRGAARTSSCSTRPSRSRCRSTRGGSRHGLCPARPAPGGSRCRLPRAAASDHLDVWFAPAYSAPLRLQTPIVVAIHDLSFVAHPEWFRIREGVRRRWLTRRSASKASAVVTISEFSKRELIERLDVPEGRIHVIPPGIRIRNSEFRIRAFSPPGPVRRLDFQSPPRRGSDPLVCAARARARRTPRSTSSGTIAAILGRICGRRLAQKGWTARCGGIEYVTDAELRESVRAGACLRVSVGVRRAGADTARGARGRRAAGTARHARGARELRRCRRLRPAGRRASDHAGARVGVVRRGDAVADSRRRARRSSRNTVGRARRERRWPCWNARDRDGSGGSGGLVGSGRSGRSGRSGGSSGSGGLVGSGLSGLPP